MEKKYIQQKTFEKRNFYRIKDTSNLFFLTLIFGLILSLVYALIFTSIMLKTDPTFNMDKAQGTPVYMINYFVSAILLQAVFLLVYYCYHFSQRISFKASNIHKPNVKESLVWSGLGVVCLLGFMCLIEGCFGHAFSVLKIDTSDMKFGNFGIYFAAVIFLGLLPAVVEELIFRGVLYQGMKNHFSLWARVVISGLLFALMHQSPIQFIYPLILGCVLSLIMEKTNNLLYCMMFHFANNFSTLTVGYIMEVCNFDFLRLPITWWFVLVSIAAAVAAAGIIFLALKFVKSKKVEVEEVGEEPTSSRLMLGKMPLLFLLGMIICLIIIVINLFV